MPVALREYSIDANGKQTKDFLSETKTVWEKTVSEDHRWIPKHLESIYSDKSEHRSYDVDLAWIELEKLDEWVSEIDFRVLFDEKGTDWYRNISKVILEKKLKEDRKPINR